MKNFGNLHGRWFRLAPPADHCDKEPDVKNLVILSIVEDWRVYTMALILNVLCQKVENASSMDVMDSKKSLEIKTVSSELLLTDPSLVEKFFGLRQDTMAVFKSEAMVKAW